jgi:hypothetical protein
MIPIPVIIFHVGNQDYFKKCVELNRQHNDVIIIGDDSNSSMLNHINMNTLDDTNIKRFRKCFINYSTNGHDYELFCFLRVFYIREYLLKHNINKIFHLDSDCVLFDNISEMFKDESVVYSIQNVENPYHMVGSIHNALIDLNFCDTFIQLCFDIYENKSKFHLIDEKMKWHKKNNVPGGICDMTIYYLMTKLLTVKDINLFSNKVFDHNISSPYGYLGENTFKMNNGIKVILKKDKYYFQTNTKNVKKSKDLEVMSMHFQGNKKQLLFQI